MNYLVQKAFRELYPEKSLGFDARIKYSRAFRGYNANVKYTNEYMEFRLSYLWKEVSDEIKIGLLQSLLNKIYKTEIGTINIDMYEIFIKKLPSIAKKIKSHPILEESFNRMNQEYFVGMMLQPNLEFGGKNFHTLGTYTYADDTIMISSVLLKDLHLLDYVMYHEMLHKKFKYEKKGKKTIHHSREFRESEKRFSDPDVEAKLKNFLKKEKIKEAFWFL